MDGYLFLGITLCLVAMLVIIFVAGLGAPAALVTPTGGKVAYLAGTWLSNRPSRAQAVPSVDTQSVLEAIAALQAALAHRRARRIVRIVSRDAETVRAFPAAEPQRPPPSPARPKVKRGR